MEEYGDLYLLPSIASFLRELPRQLEEQRLVVLVLDGLGTLELNVPGIRRMVYRTVFPSSTPAFLYTLHSLLDPEEHCFLEWYMRFRDGIVRVPAWEDVATGRQLELGRDVEMSDVFPFRPLLELLSERGFKVVYYTPHPDSTFTRAVSRGVRVRGIKYMSQLFPLEDVDFILAYWPSIDVIAHERYLDEAVMVELEIVELVVRKLMDKLPVGTKLYVLTDHGMTLCRRTYTLPPIDSVAPVGGSRVAFYRGVDVDTARAVLEELGVDADVFSLAELKYFSRRPSPGCVERYGETVVVARDGVCFTYPFEKDGKRRLGAHGGPSSSEMSVYVWEYTRR
jgi:hypothetical protein